MSRIPRVYLDLELLEGAEIRPDERVERHLVKVLRLRQGSPLTVFDGRGHEHRASLAAGGGRSLLRIGEQIEVVAESPVPIELIQGISRGERMDLVIQKATELGVAEIRPVFTQRSVVRLNDKRASRRLDHWHAVAVSACEQCGRATLPVVHPPENLYLALRKLLPGATRLVLDAKCTGQPIAEATDRVVLLIGPEGGLTDVEKETAGSEGFQPVTLGPRVMRTETAALAAVAIAQWLWGDLSVNR